MSGRRKKAAKLQHYRKFVAFLGVTNPDEMNAQACLDFLKARGLVPDNYKRVVAGLLPVPGTKPAAAPTPIRYVKPPTPAQAAWAEQRAQERDEIAGFYESWEWKKLSYETRLKAGQRCMCCGATPDQPGVRIVCDHIKPVRRFWHLRLDPANLQVLCRDCNMGKASHDETDWRPR